MSELPAIIPFDSMCLSAAVSESRHLIGGRIQKILRVRPNTIALAIYSGQEEEYVSLSVDPRLPGMYLMSRRPETDEIDHFVRLLRQQLMGGRIGKWEQRGLDRILDIGASSSSGDFQLVYEFTGGQSNAYLLDSKLKILATERKTKAAGGRDLRVGGLYEGLPPRDSGSVIDAESGQDLKGREGYSRVIGALIDSGVASEEIVRVWRAEDWSPCVIDGRGAYPISLEAVADGCFPRTSYSVAAEGCYEGIAKGQLAEQAKRDLNRRLTSLRDKLQKVLDQISKAEEDARKSDDLQALGDLILAYQSQIPKGAERFETHDFSGNPVTIELDAELGPVKNAERLYRRSKKLRASAEAIPARRAEVEDQLRSVLDQLEDVEQRSTQELYQQALLDTRQQVEARQSTKERPFEGKSIRTTATSAGRQVVYGTNAEANDYLLRRLGKPNDLWFHVRGANSAHALLLTEGKPERVNPQEIEEVARIVVRHSGQKHSSLVPVDYTLKKFVKRQKGKVPGAAVYSNEKTIHVEKQP